MSDYTILMVNPHQLASAPHQPPDRGGTASLNQLKNSIKDIGLQYPPLVLALPENNFQIIDGHRRIEACIELAWPKIPVLVTQGRPDKLFSGVSGNVAKMKAWQWVYVYLKGGDVPPGPTRTSITKLEAQVGRAYLEKLQARKLSPAVWTLAKRVTSYCQELDLDEVLEWLI